MTTTSKVAFVRMEEWGTSASGRTRIYKVWSTANNSFLGDVKWYSPWRRYVFYPANGVLFDAACLKDITNHLVELMANR